MTKRLHYGSTAKTLHWAVVALLVIQYSIGWLMPDVHGGPPGVPMTWHISIGTVILALILAQFLWRVTHPVAPESSLPPWQRIASNGVHWLLYLLVLLTTMSGWLFASARGWSVSWFFVAPLPMLTSGNRALVNVLDGWHQNFMWALLVVAGLHAAAAFVHLFYYRDGVMRRMLPRQPSRGALAGAPVKSSVGRQICRNVDEVGTISTPYADGTSSNYCAEKRQWRCGAVPIVAVRRHDHSHDGNRR